MSSSSSGRVSSSGTVGGNIAAAALKLLGSLAIGTLLQLLFDPDPPFFLILGFLTGVTLGRTNYLHAKVALHARRSAAMQETMSSGNLPVHFVLFLRGFASDAGVRERCGHIALGLEHQTPEQLLQRTLPPKFKMITVGDPREGMPKLGALRLYFDNDEWQVAVERLMRDSTFILMRPGDGGYLGWELERVADFVGPERFALAGEGVSAEDYRAFVERHPLLAKLDPSPKEVPYFQTFNEDWSPRETKYRIETEIKLAQKNVLSCEAKPTGMYWSVFGMIAMIHYASIFTCSILWTRTNQAMPLTAVIFLIGLVAWFLQLVQFLYFRKRSTTIARLNLIVFITSLFFGLLSIPPTD